MSKATGGKTYRLYQRYTHRANQASWKNVACCISIVKRPNTKLKWVVRHDTPDGEEIVGRFRTLREATGDFAYRVAADATEN